jgi:hypothetical protein
MSKTDFKKNYKQLYKPSAKAPVIVEVPPLQFLRIEGIDAREGTPAFTKAIEALFGVAYKMKFLLKKEAEFDYTVMPMEGLWWADDMDDFLSGKKENWRWNLMIMQPEQVDEALFKRAVEEVKKKKDNPQIDNLYLETFEEGLSAQILHIGPFSEEHGNIMKLHELIEKEGGKLEPQHRHHEIYLSDFRRTAPEKLKTVLRQPFSK